MATSAGGKVTSEQKAEKEYVVTIEMEGAPAAEDDAQDDNTVVVISSDRMGTGNDELGKVLIKGFIFAVTQLDKLPKTMLFYNGCLLYTSCKHDREAAGR